MMGLFLFNYFTIPPLPHHNAILETNCYKLLNILARAIENQCYVFAAAQYGIHNEKRKSFGHAIGIDPWGNIVADAGGYPRLGQEQEQKQETHNNDDEYSNLRIPSIVTCEVDLGYVESTRKRMPLQLHRKNAEDAACL